jgi:hypothetical protein
MSETRGQRSGEGAIAQQHRNAPHDERRAPGRGDGVRETEDRQRVSQPISAVVIRAEAPRSRHGQLRCRVVARFDASAPTIARASPQVTAPDRRPGGLPAPRATAIGVTPHHGGAQMAPRRSSIVAAALVIGTIAAVTEMVSGLSRSRPRSGVSPRLVLQSIASGVLGQQAYSGGAATVLLGIAFPSLDLDRRSVAVPRASRSLARDCGAIRLLAGIGLRNGRVPRDEVQSSCLSRQLLTVNRPTGACSASAWRCTSWASASPSR